MITDYIMTRRKEANMKKIKILGADEKSKNLFVLFQQVAAALSSKDEITNVQDAAEIISYGVLTTPAVMIDGKVVFAGSVPSKEMVEFWIKKK